jgi:hypothetical protein
MSKLPKAEYFNTKISTDLTVYETNYIIGALIESLGSNNVIDELTDRIDKAVLSAMLLDIAESNSLLQDISEEIRKERKTLKTALN